MSSRRVLVLGAVVIGVAVIALAGWLMWRPAEDQDQCAKPVSERTGGWMCYEP